MFDQSDHLNWLKSTYCGNSACVEVAYETMVVHMRDSKVSVGPHLIFTHEVWKTFVARVRAGDYDVPIG